MYAGKTTRLIDLYNRCTTYDKIIIDYDIGETKRDCVMKANLESHNKIIVPNVHRCKKLFNLYNIEKYELFSEDILQYYYGLFQDSKHIFINECQFFGDLKPFVLEMLSYGKYVYLFGLDGDFQQNLMGQTAQLIPYADHVEKIKGKCNECSGSSLFSYRILKNKKVYLPDASAYIPLCRDCFNEKQEEEQDEQAHQQ